MSMMSPEEIRARKVPRPGKTEIINLGPKREKMPRGVHRMPVVSMKVSAPPAHIVNMGAKRAKLPGAVHRMPIVQMKTGSATPVNTLGKGKRKRVRPVLDHHQQWFMGPWQAWNPLTDLPGMAPTEGGQAQREPGLPVLSAGEAGKLGHLEMFYIDRPDLAQPGLEDSAMGRCPWGAQPQFSVIQPQVANYLEVPMPQRPAVQSQIEYLGALGQTDQVKSAQLQQLQREDDRLSAEFAQVTQALDKEKASWLYVSQDTVLKLSERLSQIAWRRSRIDVQIKAISKEQAARNAAQRRVQYTAATKTLHKLGEEFPGIKYDKAISGAIKVLSPVALSPGELGGGLGAIQWLLKHKIHLAIAAGVVVALPYLGKAASGARALRGGRR